jgi:DNA polymerase III subunit alpha, Gram-positive type
MKGQEKKRFSQIFAQIQWEEKLKRAIEKTWVNKIDFYKKTGSLELFASSDSYISFMQISKIEEKLQNYLACSSVSMKVQYPPIPSAKEILENYQEDLLAFIQKKMPMSIGILHDARFTVEGFHGVEVINVHLTCGGEEVLRAKACDRAIERLLLEMFNTRVKVQFFNGEKSLPSEKKILENTAMEIGEIYALDDKERMMVKENTGSYKNNPNPSSKTSNPKENNFRRTKLPSHSHQGIVLGKAFGDEIVKMEAISLESGTVAFKGEVFRVEIRDIRGGDKLLVSFDITDYTSSLTVKFFVKKDKFEEIKGHFCEGAIFMVRGDAQYDKFSRELSVLAKDIVLSQVEVRQDTAKKKRVELHLHTQMSAMDGMNSIKNYIKRAAQWGHPAIAVTDHGVVQAFPRCHGCSRKE